MNVFFGFILAMAVFLGAIIVMIEQNVRMETNLVNAKAEGIKAACGEGVDASPTRALLCARAMSKDTWK